MTGLTPKAQEALDRLEAIASNVALAAGYWITDGDCSEENYCGECIVAAVAARVALGFPDAIRDGGWCVGHDSVPACRTCGTKIDYTLTSSRAREELLHFAAALPGANIGPNAAHDLVMAINASRDANAAETILLMWVEVRS